MRHTMNENDETNITDREKARLALVEYLGTEVYLCTRDHSAWGHGTMSLDDFELARDHDDLVESILDVTLGAETDESPRYELFPDTRAALDALTIRPAASS